MRGPARLRTGERPTLRSRAGRCCGPRRRAGSRCGECRTRGATAVVGAAVATSPSSRRPSSAASAPSWATRRPRLRSAGLAAWAGSARRFVSGRNRAHTAAVPWGVRRVSSWLRNAAGSGDEQVADLTQRGGAGLDGAVAGDAELADRLDDAGGVGGGCGRFAREHLAGSGLSVDGVVLAATRAQMGVRLVDLDHSATLIDQRPCQSRTERPGGLDTDRCDRAERREPRMGQAVAGTGRRERLCAQYSPERVERGHDVEVGVAVNPADHRLLWIWHAEVGHLGAAVPGRDGHNSDEASVGAGSYEVTSLVPDRPQLASPRSRPATSTRPRQGTHNAQGQFCGKSDADGPLPAHIFTVW